MTAIHSSLESAKKARQQLRAKLDQAACALTTAQQADTSAAEHVRLRAQELEAADTKAVYEAASDALASSKVDQVIAGRDLKSKEHAHAQALSEFRAGEARVSREVERIIDSEKSSSFADFEEAVGKLATMAARLRGLIPDELNRRIGQALPLSPTSCRILDALLAPKDPLHTPISELPNDYLSNGYRSDPWATRRAALSADTDSLALVHKNGDRNGSGATSLSNG